VQLHDKLHRVGIKHGLVLFLSIVDSPKLGAFQPEVRQNKLLQLEASVECL